MDISSLKISKIEIDKTS
jgi:hypothetical protein